MAYTTTNNSRLDDNACRLTQDYPAFRENLSRASSRSSTVSLASRNAYPGVPEEVLERVSQAKTTRLAARARYEAALANPDLPNSAITKLEDDLSKSEDELKLVRIECTRAKFLNQRANSSRPPLPSLSVSPLLQSPLQFPLQPVSEDPAPPLEQGEELRYRGHRPKACKGELSNKPKSARTERDHVELLGQDSTTSPRPLPLPLLVPSPRRFYPHLSSQSIPEDPAPPLEQGEEPREWDRRVTYATAANVVDGPDFAGSGHDQAKLAKLVDRRIDPIWPTLSSLLTPYQLQPGVESSAPSMEQRGKSRKLASDLDCGACFKAGEEVELPGHYKHEGHSRITVPLDREQDIYVPNVPRTATRPVPYHNALLTPVIQQRSELRSNEQQSGVYRHPHAETQPLQDQDEQEVQHYVPPTVNTHPQEQLGVVPVPVGFDQENLAGQSNILLEALEGEEIPKGAPIGRVSQTTEAEAEMEVEVNHEVGGMMTRVIRITTMKDEVMTTNREEVGMGKTGIMNHAMVHVHCGGGPPGGDPPDDGEPEGGKDGNPKRSNRKDPKKRRGVTPFSEIPEEGSSHYDFEYFEYKVESPTNLKKPLKEKVFTQFATLIEWRLFTKMQVTGDSKAQRNLINSIPKVKQYKGQNSIIVLDNFLRGLIRHMVIQGLTGPEKIEDSEGTLVVTNKDLGRTILMAGNLTEAALEWYQTYAERPPDSFEQGMKASAHRRTFLQIFRALFDRFITGAALKEIDTLYSEVKYTTLGVRQLYSDMKMYVETMPVPPDEYRFKDNLLENLPQSMRRIVLNDRLGPNTATVDEIMQRALAVESSWEAEAYYDATGSQVNVSESETDTGGESESEETQEGEESGGA
ncbi:hypothetical protein K435DRAFT_872418 [Dendrothele bispora CBS 962.96]|uniref:Uncharacterized protein n=1 Tax=Dendrothele bispora (strain CBS 962.96) TaxID=1314807 RepID=A0A4S8L1P5_DENBC|nr:hypothetical protein K435DRAFT_872418 [Dendrothele bispora CBS 962.96]